MFPRDLASSSDGDTVEDTRCPGPMHGANYRTAVFVFIVLVLRRQVSSPTMGRGVVRGREREVYMVSGGGFDVVGREHFVGCLWQLREN
jgi:hypothetical protein